jgi:hypothetical protein
MIYIQEVRFLVEKSPSTHPHPPSSTKDYLHTGLFTPYDPLRLLTASSYLNKGLEGMINDGIYRPVIAEELRAVYKAVSTELMVTGHWYTCENNHALTKCKSRVGETFGVWS